jgi:hypothetical protein
MTVNGPHFRRVAGGNSLSFEGNFSLDNSSGVALFGLSGEGEEFIFNFVSGRIVDPENRYVYSYQQDKIFSLSGNINDTSYNYYINGNQIAQSGQKNDFEVDRFFIETTGCDLTNNVFINTSGQHAMGISGFPSGFEVNEIIAGYISNTGNAGSFDVLSGEFVDRTWDYWVIGDLPSDVPQGGIKPFTLSGVRGSNGAEHSTDIRFYTSFGESIHNLTATGSMVIRNVLTKIDPTGYAAEVEDFITPEGKVVSGQLPLLEKTANYNIIHWYIRTPDGSYRTDMPLSVGLEYHDGFTGTITGAITGYTVFDGGHGYFAPPIMETNSNFAEQANLIGFVGDNQLTTGKITSVICSGGCGEGYTTSDVTIYESVSGLITEGNVSPYSATVGSNDAKGYEKDWPVTSEDRSSGFLIYGGGGSGASGFYEIPNLALGNVGEMVISDHGSGYTSQAYVDFHNKFKRLEIIEAGSGYSVESYIGTPIITFSGGTGYSGIDAQVSPLFDTQYPTGITGFNIISSGRYYTGMPDVFCGFPVTGINLINSGSGYYFQPSIIFSGGGGVGATATAYTGDCTDLTHSGYITGIDLTDGGFGYTGVPTITFSGLSMSTEGYQHHAFSRAILQYDVDNVDGGYQSAILEPIMAGSGLTGHPVLSSGAVISGLIGDLNKTFSGAWNLQTGDRNSFGNFNFVNFKEEMHTKKDNYDTITGYNDDQIIFLNKNNDNELYIKTKVNYKSSHDLNPMVSRLWVSGSGIHFKERFITGIV